MLDEVHQMVRCRMNWLEYGEKNSKYFFALEKHRGNKNVYKGLNLKLVELR